MGSRAGSGTSSVKLGLVAAPDLPAKIAYELADELPGLLANHIGGRVSWEVPVICDPLTGGEEEAPQILDQTQELMWQEGWDHAISITDLPILRSGRVVVANVRVNPGVAGISLPALGATLLRRRVREAILQLVSEIRWGTSESDRDRERRREKAQTGEDAGENTGEAHLRGGGARQLIGRRLAERLAPIQRVMPPAEEPDVDVRYIAPRARGHLRLLSGMVLANYPLTLFSKMKGGLVAAFATGTYALIFSGVRILSDSFGPPRLIAFMILSMAAIVLWLVVSYGLWDRPSGYKSRRLSRLYNTVTALTLTVAVLFSYAVLYVMALLAALFLVPADLFQMTIGRPPGLGDYLSLASVVASLSTIAGSLGLGVADEETVLKATYGYRQRRRSQEGKRAGQVPGETKKQPAHDKDAASSSGRPEPWHIHRKGRG